MERTPLGRVGRRRGQGSADGHQLVALLELEGDGPERAGGFVDKLVGQGEERPVLQVSGHDFLWNCVFKPKLLVHLQVVSGHHNGHTVHGLGHPEPESAVFEAELEGAREGAVLLGVGQTIDLLGSFQECALLGA